MKYSIKNYWTTALNQIKDIKILTLCALLISLQIAISTIYIPVAENLRAYGTFFIVSIYSMIAGPVLAMICAFIADTLGFLLYPTGAYFIGYALSAMLGALIYALFFYQRKITILKCIVVRFIVNLFINAFLGSYWTSILYTKGFIFYFTASIFKNMILLPFEVILLVFVFKAILPFLYKKKLVISDKLTLY